jgi:hypothetical protein
MQPYFVIYRHRAEGATMKRWVSLEHFVFPLFPVHVYFSRAPVTALALFLPIGVFSPSGRNKFHIAPPPPNL